MAARRITGDRGGWGYVLALALLILAAPQPLEAQDSGAALSMIPERGLQFGQLLPGVPELVSVSDVYRRAEVVLRGQGVVQVQLVHPDHMVSPGGARIPLEFGETSAGFAAGVSAPLRTFNPRRPVQVNLPAAEGAAMLYLGGTARPAADQPAGAYSAVIVVLISRTDS